MDNPSYTPTGPYVVLFHGGTRNSIKRALSTAQITKSYHKVSSKLMYQMEYLISRVRVWPK